jgi:hypothetical protein
MAEAPVAISERDPYAGLRYLAVECWACSGRAIARARLDHLKRFGGGPGIFDDIAGFLQNLLDSVEMGHVTWWLRYNLAQPLADYVNNYLVNPWWGLVNSHFAGLLNAAGAYVFSLQSSLGNIPGSIAGSIAGIPTFLGNTLAAIASAGLQGIGVVLQPLHSLSNSLPGWLSGPISNAAQSLTGGLWAGLNPLGGFIDSLRTGLAGSVSGGLYLLSNPLGSLQSSIAGFAGGFPGNLLLSLQNSLTNQWNAVTLWIETQWERISPTMIDTAGRALDQGVGFVENLFSGVASIPGAYLDYLASLCGQNLAQQPSRALTSVGALYGLSLAAGSTAHAVSSALNLVPTLNWVGASQLAALVSEAAAFSPLTNATYGVLNNEVLAQPLRYHWNQQLRPVLPTEGEIFTMGRKHGISYSEFKVAMSYQGIPDWWIDKMYDFFWTDPSPTWLLRMVEGGVPRITDPGGKRAWLDEWMPGWESDPMAWLRMKLMLSGFEDVDIEPMIEGMVKRGMQSPVTQLKTSIRAMIREAYWTEAQAVEALEPFSVRSEEVHMLYVAEELDYQKGYLDDQVQYYKEAFRKGQLTEQSLTLALSTIYTREERIAQEVARERVRKLPTPKITTEVMEPTEVKRLKTQAINSWTKQFRDWSIDAEELLLGLTIIVQDPDLAADMVAVERSRFREPPEEPETAPEDPVVSSTRRQAIASWITQFREGTITNKELETYLQPLVPDQETRELVVALEQMRYNPSPDLIALEEENEGVAATRAEYVRAHCAMFQKRTIHIEQLYNYLLADGLDERLAQATCLTQASKRIRVPAPDSLIYRDDVVALLAEEGIAGYEQEYLSGQITLATYTAWLQSIVQDPDVAIYLADVLALKRFSSTVSQKTAPQGPTRTAAKYELQRE